MNILAIDTASNICSVAVSDDERIIIEKSIDRGLSHSEVLMPLLDEVIKEANIDKKDIKLVIAAHGPGSFTGLRIGVTVANTFSQVLGIPVIGVSTLDELATNIPKTEDIICTMIDAKGGKIYSALYKNLGKLDRILEYSLFDIDELINELTDKGRVIFIGDGIKLYKEYILTHLGTSKCIFIDEQGIKKASNLIKFYYDNKNSFNINEKHISPMYIKKSQAEK